jgi:phosphatidylserine/phosphatidylglycerophosphate/cardiolipin synthase-like enzyme
MLYVMSRIIRLRRYLQFNFQHCSQHHYKYYGVAMLIACGLSSCQPQSPGPVKLKALPALPQDPLIQVYTNHNPAQQFTDHARQQTRFGDDFEQIILDTIATAKTSIDIAVQEFRLPRVAQALREKQRQGVKVRVVIENTYATPDSSYTEAELEKMPTRGRDRIIENRRLIDQNNDGNLSAQEIGDRDALMVLANGSVPLIDDTEDDSKGSKLMHHKFVVVDNRMVIVTSANFTLSDMVGDISRPQSQGNANTLLRIESTELATLFVEEFDLLWGDGPNGLKNSRFGLKKPPRNIRTVTVGNSTIDIHFSPSPKAIDWNQTSNGMIAAHLTAAKQSIDMALFVFSDQTLVDQLEPLNDRGIPIRALIESGFAYRPYSEGLDMLGISLVNKACKLERANRPWQKPVKLVGAPRLPPGDLLHHKFGIIDRTTVIVGSHNWTESANRGNDEVVLAIHNPTVAAHYQREFDRLAETAFFGVPKAIAKKAEKNNCSDQARL